jgi:hypothetical protein
MAAALNDRRLAQSALWGAVFAVVVVAASALLRLGTRLDAGGNAVSMLPAALDSFARLAHRISASLTGLAAIGAVVLALRSRPVPCPRRAPLVAIVVATAVLAAIGRYTPGYRFLGVTVANATLGVALAAAFAWLRAQAADGRAGHARLAPFLVLGAVVVEIGLGTAASAEAMHGRLAFEPLHVALGPVVAGLAAWLAVRYRGWIAAIAGAQLALGIALAAMGAARGVPGEWLHAMLACALAIALASARQIPAYHS